MISPNDIVLATHNVHKGRELEQLVRAGPRRSATVFTLPELGLADLRIDETGSTFAANARLKVDAVIAGLSPSQRAACHAVIGDDSGLIVDALSRRGAARPGVRSARFALDAGTGQGDDDNNTLLLTMMEPVPDPMRGARFASAVCAVVVATGASFEAYATVEGCIARDRRGTGGFGYDPLFICAPPHEGKRMAELTADEKNAISHRGQAMRALLARLAS